MTPLEIPNRLIEKLRKASRVTALTGAGISAESGVPTFRDAQSGIWEKFRPEDLATPAAFRRDPRLVWEWYGWRRELTAHADPNPGHLALVQIERRVPFFTLITQNVDGLHRKAGNQNIIELHGNIQRVKCMEEGTLVESWVDTGAVPPQCPNCGGLLRPDVVWFGESLPADEFRSAEQSAQTAEIFFSIGTSALVEPAASLPYIAIQQGALVVEVNPHETPLTSLANYTLKGPAGIALPMLVQAVWGKTELLR